MKLIGAWPVSDRKYRQRGYQDTGKTEEKRERPQRQETFGPRTIHMPGTRTVSRCSQCGTVLSLAGELPAQCPKCGFALHSCKQCSFFDPSSRCECTQPVPERISPKDTQNACTFYAIKMTREKETSTPAVQVTDARKAFEALFKK
jgi:hypothetical protein